MRDFAQPTVQVARLEVADVQVRRGDQVVLDIPHLVLDGAGPTLILGPNGAGKSLLLRCLPGLTRPDRGTIRQDGVSPGTRSGATQAMVFQTPVLLRRSVAGNLDFVLRRQGMARRARKYRIEGLLTEAGLSGKARQPARSLSGGEAQKLAIVRALALNPAVLFLDEPTSALDPAATAAIEGLILRAAYEGTRVVMVSHDIGQARRLSKDVVLLRAGQVAEQAPSLDFFTNPQTKAARQYLSGALVI